MLSCLNSTGISVCSDSLCQSSLVLRPMAVGTRRTPAMTFVSFKAWFTRVRDGLSSASDGCLSRVGLKLCAPKPYASLFAESACEFLELLSWLLPLVTYRDGSAV